VGVCKASCDFVCEPVKDFSQQKRRRRQKVTELGLKGQVRRVHR